MTEDENEGTHAYITGELLSQGETRSLLAGADGL